jgi:hypothetical protein
VLEREQPVILRQQLAAMCEAQGLRSFVGSAVVITNGVHEGLSAGS